MNLETAYLAPPLGLNLIISSFRFNTPVTNVYRSVLPFIAVLGVTLVVTTYVPWLSTFLPSLSKSADLSPQDTAPLPLPREGAEPGGVGLEDLGDSPGLDDFEDVSLEELDRQGKGEPAPAASGVAPQPEPKAAPGP